MISNNVTVWQVLAQTSLRSLLLSLETPNDVQSVALQSLTIQVTSLVSDQIACMHRLVWAFDGHTYHIVGKKRCGTLIFLTY